MSQGPGVYEFKCPKNPRGLKIESNLNEKKNLTYTANMCSGITVEVHLKNCNFEKLQFFTVDLCSLYFLQVKNCNFNTIFM
jgi:hypothetical protein